MSLGILILNWNQAADTISCVRSVQAWANPEDVVYVVDNGSSTAEREQLTQALTNSTLIQSQHNLGFAGGNNLGLKAALSARHDAIMLLNNDAAISETAVSKLCQALEQQPPLGMVGPSLWDADQPDRLLSAGGSDMGLNLMTHHQTLPASGEIQPVDYIPGTCILIRTAVLQKIGLLDEDYFFGGEVADLCARARENGYLCAIVGGSRAQHRVERSAQQRHQLHIYYVLRNRFLFVKKFHPQQKTRLFFYWTWQIIRIWGQAVLAQNWPRARAVALACWDGWHGRFGGQNARITRGALK